MSATVGWCPGALRPMESGDGLILRVKPSGGRLTLDQAVRVAHLALRHGNGQLDLTSRANLQIRGLTAATLEPLTAELHGAGLVDGTAAQDAVRNIVVSPLAGLDPETPDLAPILHALEKRLAEDEGLHRLPAKWGFVIDDGHGLSLAGVGADVRFVFDHDGDLRVRLDGVDGAAVVALDDVPRLVSALGDLVCRSGRPVRMRDVAAIVGSEVFDRLGLRRSVHGDDRRPAVTPADLLGDHVLFVGFAPAFGGLAAADLLVALDLLRAAGCRELRLTPWRTLLAPLPGERADVASALAALRFVVRPGDPRLSVSACVGAPACHRATTPTRRHAALLAGRGAGPVHVAGCAKGCGQTRAAPWTLVGHDGRYDVVAGGTARDAVAAQRLSFPEAVAWISRAEHARTA